MSIYGMSDAAAYHAMVRTIERPNVNLASSACRCKTLKHPVPCYADAHVLRGLALTCGWLLFAKCVQSTLVDVDVFPGSEHDGSRASVQLVPQKVECVLAWPGFFCSRQCCIVVRTGVIQCLPMVEPGQCVEPGRLVHHTPEHDHFVVAGEALMATIDCPVTVFVKPCPATRRSYVQVRPHVRPGRVCHPLLRAVSTTRKEIERRSPFVVFIEFW